MAAVHCIQSELLTPAQRRRVQETHEACTPSCGNAWIADIMQEPHFTSANAYIPALLRHSQLWIESCQRVAHPLEHLLVQGVPVCETVSDGESTEGWLALMKPLVPGGRPGLSLPQVRSLAGNAMHRPSVGAVLMFALSVMQKLPPAPRITRSGSDLGITAE